MFVYMFKNIFLEKHLIILYIKSLIIPEVGVKIVEGSKEKYGGKDYFKSYKKYSKYDYSNIMVRLIYSVFIYK